MTWFTYYLQVVLFTPHAVKQIIKAHFICALVEGNHGLSMVYLAVALGFHRTALFALNPELYGFSLRIAVTFHNRFVDNRASQFGTAKNSSAGSFKKSLFLLSDPRTFQSDFPR